MVARTRLTTQPRVRRMSEDLANQIAAGEVVERPASAVKELVENALDAGARRVRVELEKGGLSLIRVVDDGHGMSADDARLCIERHATSKLTEREQLFAIGTYGFRGEALPSIASVSRFSLTTKPHDVLGGTRIEVEGGHVADIRDVGAPPGTEVEVRDLFFNTPARLKFLKRESTELRHVTETLQRLALAYPETHFSVSHNGRTYLDLPSVDDVAQRLVTILGRDDARDMYPLLPAEQDGVTCSGYFSQPRLTRRTSAGVWTFVNRRYIRDRSVQSAIRVGYQNMIDRGRYPVVLLYLDVPVDTVDVNVHPMKTEVRFHQTDAVFRAVRRAIANSLAEAPWVPTGAEGAPAPTSRRESAHAPSAPSAEQETLPIRSYTLRTDRRFDAGRTSGTGSGASAGWVAGGTAPDAPVAREADGVGPTSDAARGASDGALASRSAFFQSLHYIGHFRGTYLLASDGDGLVVVDQHAAHERIWFERLRLAWYERRREVQPLLVPQVLSFTPVRAATMSAHLEFFEGLGFEIEPFGGTEFALKSAPVVLGQRPLRPLLRDTLDELAEYGASNRLDDAIDAILLRMACHGSIRAGDVQNAQEVSQLFRELDAVDFGANCPHGRPVYFRLSIEELETRFDRR